DRDRDDQERWTYIGRQLIFQSDQAGAQIPVLPILRCETPRNRIHLLLFLRQRHSRIQARDNVEPERAALEAQIGRDHQRFPEIDLATRIPERRWHNARYGIATTVKRNSLADDRAVGAESPHP